MKIAQVLHSSLDLNNLKFGGAERVVRNYHKILAQHHHSYIVHDGEINDIFKKLELISPDVVMCHSDYLTGYLAKRYQKIKFLHISHNPYAELASGSPLTWIKWHKLQHSFIEVARDLRMMQKYNGQIRNLLNFKNVLITSLSKRIANKNLKFGVKQPFYYLPNPIDETEFLYHEHIRKNRLLCVGKIDLRKRQYLVQQKIANVDFVGPRRDKVFSYDDKRYLGELSHTELHELMLKYDGLILASDGEAMPQVIFEGLLCGLRLFLTNDACWDLAADGKMVVINDNIEVLGSNSMETFKSVKEDERYSLRQSIVNEYSVNNINFYNKYILPVLSIMNSK